MSVIWWRSLCGNESEYSAFWSDNLTLNSPSPDLTQCFQDSILVWVPCGYLWLVTLLAYCYVLLRTPTRDRHGDTSLFNLFKFMIGVLLCLTVLIDLIKTITEALHDDGIYPVDYIKPALTLMTLVLATALIRVELYKGVHSGGVLFWFWILLAVLGIVPFRSYILRIQYAQDGQPIIENVFHFATFYIYYALVLIQVICSFFSDKAALPRRMREEERPLRAKTDETEPDLKPCPELSAPYLSRLTFFWITKLVITGYRRSLVYSDVWHLSQENRSDAAVPALEKEWQKERATIDFRHAFKTNPDTWENEVLDEDDMVASRTKTKGKKTKDPSVFKSLARGFGGYYMLGGLYKLIYDIITFINPILLNLLISFIDMRDPLAWRGYFLVILLFLVSMTRTVILQQYWNVSFIVGMRMRSAVIGTIYRKALRLNNVAKRESTVGEIVNLMSVDAQKFQDVPAYLHMIWSTPLTVGVAMYFLWQQLGPSVLAGLGLMLLLVPLNAVIAQKTRTLQIDQMQKKDKRIKLMNEILNGIKVLKLYAWENSFKDRALDIREEELKTLKTAAYLSAASAISWFMAPYLVALGSFAVFVLSSPDNILDANKAFVSLSLFNIINYPMSILPATIAFGVQASVSIGRIKKFLTNEEIDPDNVTRDLATTHSVTIEDGTFTWGEDDLPILKHINLKIPDGSLAAVVGQVGTGKSSLISAMLGEMERVHGQVSVTGSVAYVPQQAWIQNATLRDNILFGKKYQKERYNKVVWANALEPDLKILPGGDQTEIGEKGINVSGGQKQRVSLARAVYHDSDVYLLDDPLSAVDAHVGKHIFEHVIGPTGLLKNKTRILVTNSIGYLPKMDFIVVLRNGEISEMGTYDELLQQNGAFADFILTYLQETEDSDEEDEQMSEMRQELKRQLSAKSDASEDVESEYKGSSRGSTGSVRRHLSNRSPGSLKHRISRMTSTSEVTTESDMKDLQKQQKQKLTEEETAMTGNVEMAVFVAYARACSTFFIVCAAVSYLIYLASQVGANLWLSLWSTDQPNANGTIDTSLRDLRLGVYGAFGATQAVGVLGLSFGIAIACVNASRILHADLMRNILQAPMAFFDTTPLGRIINRFSRDIDTVDINIPLTIRIWTGTFSGVITTIFVISYSTPIFLAVVLPLGVFYYFIQRFYICTSRQLKRIDSVRKSPIYAHFGETITGISSIRAYREQDRFIALSDKFVDENQMVYYPSVISNRWLGMGLEFIGNLIVLFAGLFAVIQKDTLSAGLAGLSVTYALQVTGALNMVVRMTSDLETYIVAVERIREYADCPKEAPPIVEGNRPSKDWPKEGKIEFQQYSTRYRPGLDLVLKEINCKFNPGEKVGIVGRTGAGKTSLTLSLFRIIEAASGIITIDDQTIGQMGLYDLRSKLTVIPQDPVLFSGTLRLNLDPLDCYSDIELWEALEHAHLKSYVTTLAEGLQHQCAEGGENLSVGQRQLVCLARALLRKTKILVLDEATAAIDLETDDLIQATIRTEFKECTVVTIAHRLNTIMDYDRVLVLGNGQIVEFDTPDNLLKEKTSVFYSMSKDAGLV